MTPDKPTSVEPRLRFPEFRSAGGWHFEPLTDVAALINDRVGASTTSVPMSVTTGVGLVSQEEKFGRTIAGDSYKNYVRLQTNDFAYNKSATKAFPQGYIARYSGTKDAAVPNSIFSCFRADTAAVVPEYLDHLFHGNHHGRWLRKFITVGARAHGALSIGDTDLMSMPVPLPPNEVSLREQQKIADCFGSLDDLIAAEGRMLDALQEHKQSLLQQLFPQRGQDQPLRRLPEFCDAPDWVVKPLGEIADYQNGKAYEKDIVEAGRFVVVNARFISTNGAVRKYSNETYCIADVGDVLMVLSDLPTGRALARCFQVGADETYAVNQRVARLRPRSVDSGFLLYALDRHPWLMAFQDGVNQTHLSKGAVLDCPITAPQVVREQERISECLTTVDQQIAAQTRKSGALGQYRLGLMQQLFPSPESA
jgi:type I restriction enzyme S subunit